MRGCVEADSPPLVVRLAWADPIGARWAEDRCAPDGRRSLFSRPGFDVVVTSGKSCSGIEGSDCAELLLMSLRFGASSRLALFDRFGTRHSLAMAADESDCVDGDKIGAGDGVIEEVGKNGRKVDWGKGRSGEGDACCASS